MATGSVTDGDPAESGRIPSPRAVGRAVLHALVSAPGRSAATLLIAGPYLWLGYYVVGTATGRLGDVIVGDEDCLFLVAPRGCCVVTEPKPVQPEVADRHRLRVASPTRSVMPMVSPVSR
jgi:hypothetical protein